jgi:tRNA threonylcarbamoyladenosine biosynthesis protein TsaE
VFNERKVAEYISNSPEETMKIARKIARTLVAGDIMYLYGELGSGKTVFVKGLCTGLGVDEEVTSPSFVIATEYRGTIPVAHIDLYRLQRGMAGDLPIEEYMLPNGLTVIEWADRIDVLRKGIRVNIDIINRTKRVIKIEDLRN